MRHGKKVAKLGRGHSHRKAMVANMVTSLFDHEAIRTTSARAKAVRRTAEHMITFAKRGDLHARRQVLRLIPDKRVVRKLFEELGPATRAATAGTRAYSSWRRDEAMPHRCASWSWLIGPGPGPL